MARKKLSMRQIHEILRLKHQNQLSIHQIARSCGLPASTVGDYLQRAETAGIGSPPPEGLSEQELVERLMAAPPPEGEPCQVLSDWTYIRHGAVTFSYWRLAPPRRDFHPPVLVHSQAH